LHGDPFSERNDEIYPELERNEKSQLMVHVDSEDNKALRSIEDMEKEAMWLKGLCTE
jgi:hypothetical protein